MIAAQIKVLFEVEPAEDARNTALDGSQSLDVDAVFVKLLLEV